jgi:hypothetical protein
VKRESPQREDPLITPPREDRDWPLSDWRYEVGNGDTILGYTDWVAHQKEGWAKRSRPALA